MSIAVARVVPLRDLTNPLHDGALQIRFSRAKFARSSNNNIPHSLHFPLRSPTQYVKQHERSARRAARFVNQRANRPDARHTFVITKRPLAPAQARKIATQ